MIMVNGVTKLVLRKILFCVKCESAQVTLILAIQQKQPLLAVQLLQVAQPLQAAQPAKEIHTL
jgi:hypothetical protein